MITYYSTENKNLKASLEEAVLHGLAPDGGLYMPNYLPAMPESFIKKLPALSFQEIAFEVGSTLFQGEVPSSELKKIIDTFLIFDAPLKAFGDTVFALELFYGPTWSFKDFGAQFMAGLLGYFVQKRSKQLYILVATSGDTGSAVAQGFLGVPGIHVGILYPEGKVTLSQEKQLTTMDENITALEIMGTFDDCQRLVKQAFSDKDLAKSMQLTSANSINVARLIPQSFYYFRAYGQLPDQNKPVVFSVPSGNFGNLCAGLIAKRMGLPVSRFIAPTNANDSVPRYLKTGHFEPKPSIKTISNAMDVGNPSNFRRMLDFYGYDRTLIAKDIFSKSFSDKETEDAMKHFFLRYGYQLDPHGAVGYLGLMDYLPQHQGIRGIFLETAHPCKFAYDVERITGKKVDLPERFKAILKKEKKSVKLSNKYEDLKDFLLAR